MAIRYVAAPMLGPSAREERMREERQKTMAKSAESLSRGWLRQKAIDAALEQQRNDRSGFPQAGTRQGFAADQAAGTPTSVVRPSAPWGGPAVDTAKREQGAGRAADAGVAHRAGLLGIAAASPGATLGSATGEAPPSFGLELEPLEYDPELVRRIQASEDAQLAEQAAKRMASERARVEREMGERVDARLAAEAIEARSLPSSASGGTVEDYSGAGTSGRYRFRHPTRRDDPERGDERMAAAQAAKGGQFGQGGYGINTDEGQRYRAAPGPISEFVDDAPRVDRIGEAVAPTSDTRMVEGSDLSTSPMMEESWRRAVDSGLRGTLQEGLEAYKLALEGRGNQWFDHFISGESGATQEVFDMFAAYIELAEMADWEPEYANEGSWSGSKAAKRLLRSERAGDNIEAGDLDSASGMPLGDDPPTGGRS